MDQEDQSRFAHLLKYQLEIFDSLTWYETIAAVFCYIWWIKFIISLFL